MVQKDYVRQGGRAPRKDAYASKKKSNQELPKRTLAVAIITVIVFIGGLYCITQNKRAPVLSKSTSPNSNQAVNSLPPKPKERWNYIKELEKRGSDLASFNHSSKSNINNTTELTNKQRQFLEQIDADKRNPVTNLSEVLNSEVLNKDNVSNSHVSINDQPIESPLRLKSSPYSQQLTNNQQKILVQCSSFKNLEQAESVKANLAFLGLESQISLIEGWYYVVLGPYNQETAEKIRDRARSIGVFDCLLRIRKS